MKKIKNLMVSILGVAMLASCGVTNDITVVSREDGSGTRSAFVELFEVEQKDSNGNKVDMTTENAQISNNTSVIMTTVADDVNAIGYISLGSLNGTVKAVNINNVKPTVDNVKNGSYEASRPFNIVTTDGVSEVAKDFISYILSSEGQDIVESKNYIRIDDTGAYEGKEVEGKVVVAGSSSVTPVMEVLKEGYESLNPNVKIEIQQSDSSTGIKAVTEGICDIGMASRDLKDSETGLDATVIALDGIVVVVNNESQVSNLTKEQVQGIYTGLIINWDEIN